MGRLNRSSRDTPLCCAKARTDRMRKRQRQIPRVPAVVGREPSAILEVIACMWCGKHPLSHHPGHPKRNRCMACKQDLRLICWMRNPLGLIYEQPKHPPVNPLRQLVYSAFLSHPGRFHDPLFRWGKSCRSIWLGVLTASGGDADWFNFVPGVYKESNAPERRAGGVFAFFAHREARHSKDDNLAVADSTSRAGKKIAVKPLAPLVVERAPSIRSFCTDANRTRGCSHDYKRRRASC